MATIRIPIKSTVYCGRDTIKCPCPVNVSSGSPILSVSSIMSPDYSISIYSVNNSDGNVYEICKFKDGSDMIVTQDTTKQIVMQKGGYSVIAEMTVPDDKVKKLTEVQIGDDLNHSTLIFPIDKEYSKIDDTSVYIISFTDNMRYLRVRASRNSESITERYLQFSRVSRLAIPSTVVLFYFDGDSQKWKKGSYYLDSDDADAYKVEAINPSDQGKGLVEDTIVFKGIIPKVVF